MDLHELLKDWPCTFKGESFAVPITGVTEHSGRVKPGDLFVARIGGCTDGMNYIREAIQSGAAAVVVDREMTEEIAIHTPLITVPDANHFLAYASAQLAGNPSEQLTVIAITGTNGKTTVAHFIGQLLQFVGVKAAVMGTLGLFIDGVHMPYALPKLTTLPAEYLHPVLKRCVEQGVTHFILEASSMGLEAGRLAYCDIDTGVFLNISEDHYDEHGSQAAYIQAKQRLVKMADKLMVNRDDPNCRDIAEEREAEVMYFGQSHEACMQYRLSEGKISLKTPSGYYPFTIWTKEAFNQMNAIAAMSVLFSFGFSPMDIDGAVHRLKLPEGRMERIVADEFEVIIDYAHTPDALKLVLEAIRKVCDGKIIVVFGCGGNRDQGKRRRMGEIAGRYAEKVIITSDNPRRENPQKIIDEIAAGIRESGGDFTGEIDRQVAIQSAISYAKKGDIILIAGKGHEKTQEIAGCKFPFSDREMVRQLLLKQSYKVFRHDDEK